MTVISIILGVLLVIGGFSLVFTPLSTFLGLGYFIIILFFVSGLFGVIRGISNKNYGLDFFSSILSLVLGIVGIFIPGDAALATDYIILFLAAGWFIIHGIITIILAVKSKKIGASTGAIVCGTILGIVELLMGIYSIAHPMVLAITVGWLIGFYFIESGINMIILGSALSGKKE